MHGIIGLTTAGGGWMLVFAYTFSDYANFTNGDNGVVPHPNGPAALSVTAQTLLSVTTPSGEEDFNAMPFNRWAMLTSTGEF